VKQVVSLGDRVNGQIEIVALGVEFVEKPATFKYDKYSTYKSIYLEVTQDVLKEIDAYYLSIKNGDEIYGISNPQPYYKILGIKYYDGMFQQTMSYEELMERWEFWSPYMNLPDNWVSVSFVVEVL
jgi:hypothetical protein